MNKLANYAPILVMVVIGIGLLYIATPYVQEKLNLSGVASGIYPNSSLTPGVTNPDVSQGNIQDNICNPNWRTGSIRPPSNYTSHLKIQQIREYGYKDTNPTHYEEDHLISLTDGGNPTDPKNLWPESYPMAKEKDRYELFVHKQICTKQITLREGQRRLSQAWYKYYQEAGLGKNLGSVDNQIDLDDGI